MRLSAAAGEGFVKRFFSETVHESPTISRVNGRMNRWQSLIDRSGKKI
jgi:hypothetical protein